ncbi:RagB/SusD family nutrient uptake outer membrane protein [Tenacibaculum sp. IB213877]|uniref:RagB/SusD family nutrient uptake outer membrane protein n=1 Tax=Tenacibaculum sp. IB213877 TaxID=3097351 RepID=UPI002A5A0920|nr:RagB/SusD family nutrient uptake outer membrane protein [Tenacibaculum sp. IB213877]MDY0781674.1 RagB/SusD family nutrient uptake outer membrane protein [Tenacibaculum sp. IB213877]
MNKIYLKLLVLGLVAVFQSCELDELPNQNAPTLDSFAEGATAADVEALAVGLEAITRNDLEYHYQTVSYLAREYHDLTGTDPRYTGEILKGPLDNNGFLTTRAYAAWYRVVKSANVLINAVDNSSAGFTDAEKNSYYGFAKTVKAYALLMSASRQYTNGIRIDVADPDNLGPFVGYDEALVQIRNLFNEANNHLLNSPDNFEFPSTFARNTDSFIEFNRALTARVALYQGDMSSVLTLLDDSFLDLDGDLMSGVAHIFGLAGNDLPNNQFNTLGDDGPKFMVHNTWVADAEANDSRVNDKSLMLSQAATFDNLSATHQFALYKSNTDSVYLIRNEELILMYAEANIGTNNPEAINAINIVRNAAGLPDYSGGTLDDELIEEVLHQRRYSLFGEGHRWIDLRRLDRLNSTYVPLDRAGDNIIDAFPTPFSELGV